MAWRNQSSRCVHQSRYTSLFQKNLRSIKVSQGMVCTIQFHSPINHCGGRFLQQADENWVTHEVAQKLWKRLSQEASRSCQTGFPKAACAWDNTRGDHWIRCSVSSFPSKAAKRFWGFTLHSHYYPMQVLQTKKKKKRKAEFWPHSDLSPPRTTLGTDIKKKSVSKGLLNFASLS